MIGSKVRLRVPPVALAFPEFRDGTMIKTPGSTTEFKVSIEKPRRRALHPSESGTEMGADHNERRTG